MIPLPGIKAGCIWMYADDIVGTVEIGPIFLYIYILLQQ